MTYYNVRRLLELKNERDETLQRNVFTGNVMKATIIERWRKMYGKKFPNLTIIEIIPEEDEKLK